MQKRRRYLRNLFAAVIIITAPIFTLRSVSLRQTVSRAQSSQQLAQNYDLRDSLISSTIINSRTPDEITSPVEPPGGDDPPLVENEFEHQSEVVLWAINPGYRVNNQAETGELIELRNLSGETVDLTGFSLRYTNSSGNMVTLIEFQDGSKMQGETILLRFSKSPDRDAADLVYTTSLAMSAGPLELWQDNELVDTVCWTGKNGCVRAFKSAIPTTLVRNLETGEFIHQEEYLSIFDHENPGLLLPNIPGDSDETADDKPTSRCHELEFSEVYTYYIDNKIEQFIELYNPSAQVVSMDGCQLRYKKKLYALSGVIDSGGYHAYYPNGKFSLTKNPNTSNVIELIDIDERVVDELTYLHGQKKGTSYAKFYDATGAEAWSHTYARTPGQANVYQEFRTCEAGKVINPETGNCVKADTVTDANGVCPAGKYRNPSTGRCKKIETEKTKECAPGYERNPETKRCRKIKSANTGADYTLVPTTSGGKNVFIAAGIVITIIALGVLYVVWQFRREIVRTFRKAHQRVHDVRKDFLSRRSGRHRDK